MSDDAKKEAAKLKSALTRRLKKLFAQTLEPLGLVKTRGQEWERATNTMRQFCLFRFINGRCLAVEYGYCKVSRFDSCVDCWANAPQDAATQETLTRFKTSFKEREKSGAILDMTQTSLSYPPQDEEEIEKILTDVEPVLRDATAYFLNYPETSDLLRAYEAGRVEKKVFSFGTDPLWQDFYLALEYYRIGAYAKSAEAFEEAARASECWDSWVWDVFDQDDIDFLAIEAAKIGADCMRRLAESQGKAGE